MEVLPPSIHRPRRKTTGFSPSELEQTPPSESSVRVLKTPEQRVFSGLMFRRGRSEQSFVNRRQRPVASVELSHDIDSKAGRSPLESVRCPHKNCSNRGLPHRQVDRRVSGVIEAAREAFQKPFPFNFSREVLSVSGAQNEIEAPQVFRDRFCRSLMGPRRENNSAAF